MFFIEAITEELEVKKRKEVILQKSLENTDHAIAQLSEEEEGFLSLENVSYVHHNKADKCALLL